MKFSLSTPFLDRKGQPMMDGDAAATAQLVLFAVIDAPLPDDVGMASATKLRLAQLGIRIAAGPEEIDLPAADVTLLLERAARVVSTLVYGQLVLLLDPGQLEA